MFSVMVIIVAFLSVLILFHLFCSYTDSFSFIFFSVRKLEDSSGAAEVMVVSQTPKVSLVQAVIFQSGAVIGSEC